MVFDGIGGGGGVTLKQINVHYMYQVKIAQTATNSLADDVGMSALS